MNPSFSASFHERLGDLILEVGAFIEQEAQTFSADKIEYKGKNDLVSYVDKTAEAKLVRGCKLLLPDSGFINEESGVSNSNSPYRWIIDPLDGTTNFMHGIDCYAISVALQYMEQTVLGYVYHIPNHELFSAEQGAGSYLNGGAFEVSPHFPLSQGLIATGFPYNSFGWMEDYIEVLKAVLPCTQGVRRMGSAAIDLAYVACGRFDGFFEFKLNAWDVAAGALLVQEAGGKVTDFKGGNDYLFGKQILATNQLIHPEMLALIQSKLKKGE